VCAEHVRHKPLTQLAQPRELVLVVPALKSQVNLSRMVRLAGCAGIPRIITSGPAKVDPKIARDGVEHVTIEKRRSLIPTLKNLKADGFRIVGLEQTDDSHLIYDYRYAQKTALLIGHERHGITDEELKVVDDCISRGTLLENTHVGPFLILKRLGTNRRQKVYNARQTEQNRDVALKFIKFPAKVSWQKVLKVIDIEVNELRKLRHPNLVRIYGAGVHEEKIFFASELVKGESLAALLSRRGKLTPDLVVEYGRQISEALNYLHGQNLVSSKLVPEKILVTPDHAIKVADLRYNQIGRRRWDETKQREMDIAAYMAPEQFSEGATPRSDVYALGVILFEMLTGKLPYELDTLGRMAKKKQTQPAPSVADHIMNCPIWLDQIVTRMLEPDYKQRPHSAREVVLAFEEIKKIDATKKSATSQISGNFNPLTKGADKTDAKRLLEKKELDSNVSFFQSVPFLMGALAMVVGLAIWLAMPLSTEETINRMREAVASNSPDSWRSASIKMKPLMKSDSPFAGDAESIYFEARQKMLVDLAKRGVTNSILQTEQAQQFTAAYQLEMAGEEEKARVHYLQLTQTVDPDGEQRHIFFESKQRFSQLSSQIRLPDTAKELALLVANTVHARSPQELDVAEKYLSKIFVKCSGDESLNEVEVLALRQLQIIQQRKSKSAFETEAAGNFDGA